MKTKQKSEKEGKDKKEKKKKRKKKRRRKIHDYIRILNVFIVICNVLQYVVLFKVNN